jgi:hypothetical protein
MSIDDVKSAVARALPAWAQGITSVAVRDDAAGERIVSADLPASPAEFAAHNVRGVTDSLADVQASLAAKGGNVGRTLVTITDIVTHDPLYAAGDDRLWGYSGEWISPLVVGLPGFQRVGAAVGGAPSVGSPTVPSLPDSASPWVPPLDSSPQVPR